MCNGCAVCNGYLANTISTVDLRLYPISESRYLLHTIALRLPIISKWSSMMLTFPMQIIKRKYCRPYFKKFGSLDALGTRVYITSEAARAHDKVPHSTRTHHCLRGGDGKGVVFCGDSSGDDLR